MERQNELHYPILLKLIDTESQGRCLKMVIRSKLSYDKERGFINLIDLIMRFMLIFLIRIEVHSCLTIYGGARKSVRSGLKVSGLGVKCPVLSELKVSGPKNESAQSNNCLNICTWIA